MPAITACVMATIMHFEGLRLHSYPDNGAWANGFGHRGADVHAGQVISGSRAVSWLRHDLVRAEGGVRRQTRGLTLSQGEYAALVDFTFNLGELRLRDSTLLAKLWVGDRRGAAAEFGQWVKSSGRRLPGLVTRRAVEKRWFQGAGCE